MSVSSACNWLMVRFRASTRRSRRASSSPSTSASSSHGHLPQAAVMPRGAHDRPRVERVGLLARVARELASPCRQRRRHVHDLLAASRELARHQPAQAVGVLHRPDPRHRRGPGQQLLDLLRSGRHPDLGRDVLAVVERDRGVRPLVRVDPDDGHLHERLLASKDAAADRPDAGNKPFTPLSSQAAAGPGRRQIPLKPARRSRRREDPESASRGPRR
jgi:hypothetical protein